MFLGFKIKNFFSINKEAEVNFQISLKQKKDDSSVAIEDICVNKIGCIVGPNAAGKTNLLRSFVYFSSFIRDSYLGVPWISSPHFFSTDKDTFFETEFVIDQNKYKYNIVLNKTGVIKEGFSVFKFKTNRYNSIFLRNGNEFSCKFSVNDKDKERLSKNITLFSLLKHLNYFEVNGYKGNAFPSLLHNIKMPNEIKVYPPEFFQLGNFAEELSRKPNVLNTLNKEIQNVDFGIEKISIGKASSSIQTSEDGSLLSENETKVLLVSHKYKKNSAIIPLMFESKGTINYIKLYTKIIEILESGSMLIADELESGLHIDLVERILALFMKKKTNPNNAQILFTTHNPWFLQYLTKTQIFITQKKDDLSTECFRLDDVEGVRNDENFFMKYISGEYEGKPRIKGE